MDDLNQPQPGALSVAGIKIAESAIGDDTVQTVNARELHAFLGVGRDFSDWIKEKIRQYEFVLDIDYVTAAEMSTPVSGSAKSRPQLMTQYHISLDMAKELAMVERNAKGREASRHFSRLVERRAVEKALANQQLTAVSTAVQEVVTMEQPMFLSDQFEAYLTLVEGEKDGKRQKLVDLSSLHQALEIKSDFTDWAKRSLVDVGENHHPVDRVVERAGRGPVTKHIYLVTMETAKLIAARSRSSASLRICKWLVAVEEEARKRVEAELAAATTLDTPEARIRLLETALAAERRAQTEAVARITAEATTAQLQTTVNQSVLFTRSTFSATKTAHISVKDIKAELAPWLAEDKARLVLNYYGHPKTKFQFGEHENAVVNVFEREGIWDVIQQFARECTVRISSSGRTLILTHDCLLGASIRVSKDDAIKFFGYAEDDFTS